MATSDFDVELFERRLHTLKDSQESIQGLSTWCLERRQHHKKIVATWLQVLKKVKVEHRLTLFYLANDVIQYSKRKNFEFVESWGTTLQRATTMVRDEKVKHRILRIFKIWDQRQVYDEEFLADLSGLISAAPKKKLDPQPSGPPEEFQAALLISTMRSCATLEQATDARLRDLRESNIDIENAEELCASLKDRRRVEDAEKEVDSAVRNVENYVRALEAEIRERTQVLELLEQADQFYETQRGEVKIVTNAYRNFGSRVKNLKKKLDELLPTLISPLPSPDINAPSPSPDSDIELPGDESQSMNQLGVLDVAPPSLYGTYSHDYDPAPVPAPDLGSGHETGDFTSGFSSFMGGNVDFGNMRNIFNERSSTPTGMSSQYNDSLEAKPIEVINMRPSKSENKSGDFNISSFLKTVLPSSDGVIDTGGIPGLGLDVSDVQVESPQRPEYRHSPGGGQLPVTPVISRIMSNPGVNNCQMSHSTPLPVRNLSGESHTPSPYSSQNSQSNMTVPFDTPSNNAINPLPPPPLPPPIFLDDENCYNKLPPKFPTWTPSNDSMKDSSKWDEKSGFGMPTGKGMNPSWSADCDEKTKVWMDGDADRWDPSNETTWPNPLRGKSEILSETPESPPMYEKSGFTDPVEYDDTQPREIGSGADVDHRMIPIPMRAESQLPYRLMKAGDVDHRNLISLTGSPANHNVSDPIINTTSNNSSLWSTGDHDYRQHMQSRDIVESVDMEMSDDETDSKPKGRVLVDVRSQDRDMRIGNQSGSSHPDMDMRMIPLPSGQLPGPHGQMMQDIHMLRPTLPPPPPPPNQFHPGQPGFHQDQPEFRHNSDFHGSQPNFHQSRGPGGFLQSPQDFHTSQQEFLQIHQTQPEFHQNQQDFEYRDSQHNLRPSQDFMNESQLRGRYSQSSDHHRDTPFHRNERGSRGGRGFPRNRRDRYSDDHNHKQRGVSNNRKSRTQELQTFSPEVLPNSRPLLLQPPDTVVILDNEGLPIGMPDIKKEVVVNASDHAQEAECEVNSEGSLPLDHRLTNVNSNSRDSDYSQQKSYTSGGTNPAHDHSENTAPDCGEQQSNQVTVVPVVTEPDDHPEGQYVPISEYEENVEADSGQDKSCTDNNESIENATSEINFSETSPHLSEQVEPLVNSTSSSTNDLKRPSTNGSFEEQGLEDDNPVKKRVLLTNGPQIPNSESGPNGAPVQSLTPDSHSGSFDYDSPNAGPNFRPRPGSRPPFPPWRGGPPRGRAAFRGGPRGSWMDRTPRGPSPASFMPRGLKRGGQFRGNGFRGRGRGSNW